MKNMGPYEWYDKVVFIAYYCSIWFGLCLALLFYVAWGSFLLIGMRLLATFTWLASGCVNLFPHYYLTTLCPSDELFCLSSAVSPSLIDYHSQGSCVGFDQS